jgi:large subunit ribosomal protein L6
MSRIGNKIISVPAGVTVTVENQNVTVKGPKGELNALISDLVEIQVNGQELSVVAKNDSKEANMFQGTTRANINNMVVGVSEGFKKQLEIVGVGYRAELKGNTIVVSAGYSNPVVLEIPQGIKVELPKPTIVVVSGINKQIVGQFAADIRAVREPEPYHGKGIHYSDEHVRRKEGKTAKK